MPRRRKPVELRLGLAEYERDDRGRSTADARGLFMLALTALEPEVWQSLGDAPLQLYHSAFGRHATPRPSPENAAPLARQLGWEDEILGDDEAAQEELGAEYKPAISPGVSSLARRISLAATASPDVRWPRIHWRDPVPDQVRGFLLRRDRRILRGLSLAEEAARCHIAVCELREVERGCLPNAGLTTIHGPAAKLLLDALRQCGRRFNLTDNWFFEWALGQLPDWGGVYGYSLDAAGIIPSKIEPPKLRGPLLQLETIASYEPAMHKEITDYCAEIRQRPEPAGLKRTPRKRATAGSPYQHFFWLAGYQVCGWSQQTIAEADLVDRTAVLRAINGLAKQIGLRLRRGQKYDPRWTAVRIRAAPT
jgi:hypothetical protein